MNVHHLVSIVQFDCSPVTRVRWLKVVGNFDTLLIISTPHGCVFGNQREGDKIWLLVFLSPKCVHLSAWPTILYIVGHAHCKTGQKPIYISKGVEMLLHEAVLLRHEKINTSRTAEHVDIVYT